MSLERAEIAKGPTVIGAAPGVESVLTARTHGTTAGRMIGGLR
jgi:hypothetical protein